MKIRNAMVTLTALREGQVMIELAQAFHDAAQAVKHHNKPAKVTLEVTIAPIKNVGANLVEHPIVMQAEVSTKLPKEELPSTIFFVDEEGPSRHASERQPSFPGVGIVDKSTGEISHGNGK